MNNITDKEIYQAASAVLNKYKNDERETMHFIHTQLSKYFNLQNKDMFITTLRIEKAIKELVDVGAGSDTVH